MCLRPVHIVLHRGVAIEQLNGSRLSMEREMTVPCGKCVECLKRKQNDFMQVFYTAAQQYGSMVFVTLTYRDSSLPLRCRRVTVLHDSGELMSDTDVNQRAHFYSDDLDDIYLGEGSRVRTTYFDSLSEKKYGRGKTCKICHSVIMDGIDTMNMEVQASLRRRDVRLWIKRFRVNYKRKYGKNLLAFKYVCVGEYGSKSYRPHYHLCFFGLPVSVINEACIDWNERFGFSYVKSVPVVSATSNHNDIEACSHYVAKYMTKGCFDCSSIADGLIEKPRVMISTGIVDYSGFFDYYRGTDNIIPSAYFPPTWYDENQLDKIIHRRYFCINGKRYSLGNHFIKNIFYEKEKEIDLSGNTRYKIRRIPLQNAVSSRVFSLAVCRDLEELQKVTSEVAWADVDAVEEFIIRRSISADERENFALNKLKQFYRKDVF